MYDLDDAAELLLELYGNAIPRLDIDDPLERRLVFFSPSERWSGLFPQLHAIWSTRGRVVVFYAWGFGENFLQWAASFQPDLYSVLVHYADSVVVVVPAVAKLTPELLSALEQEQRSIWRNRDK